MSHNHEIREKLSNCQTLRGFAQNLHTRDSHNRFVHFEKKKKMI